MAPNLGLITSKDFHDNTYRSNYYTDEVAAVFNCLLFSPADETMHLNFASLFYEKLNKAFYN